jgi:hypothetical protein
MLAKVGGSDREAALHLVLAPYVVERTDFILV